MSQQDRISRLTPAEKDMERVDHVPETPQTRAPAYRLAFDDTDFLCREDLRPVRFQLELLKPEIILSERGVESTVVMFGGARIMEPGQEPRPDLPEDARARLKANAKYYTEARRFAQIVSRHSLKSYSRDFVVCTGGGPGVMEAGNRGAVDVGAASIGLNIVLPFEQAPNEYVTPDLCFNFHYFAIRKMHFLMRAKAVAIFPGGFGTLDELFETLTLIQTGRASAMPVLMFGKEFWDRAINLEALAEEGTIAAADLDLLTYCETAEDGWDAIRAFYGLED